jgi:TM2 domain-containing membrane protein YozV
MFCPSCGCEATVGASFCEKCGSRLATGPAGGPSASSVGADPRMRGSPTDRGKVYATGKSPGVALFLSFLIPGVGQFYNGDTKRGLLLLGIYFVSWLLVSAGGIGFIGIAGSWIWGMINAYQVASGKAAIM